MTNSGKTNEFLRAQLGFCVVWVLLRKTKSKNNVIQELEQRPFTPSSTWIWNNRDSSLNSFFHWHPGPQRVIERSPRLPGHCVRTAEGFQSCKWEYHMSHQARINIVWVYCVIGVASVSDASAGGRVTAQVHAVWRGDAISCHKSYAMFSEPKRINLVLKNTTGCLVWLLLDFLIYSLYWDFSTYRWKFLLQQRSSKTIRTQSVGFFPLMKSLSPLPAKEDLFVRSNSHTLLLNPWPVFTCAVQGSSVFI